MQMIIKILRVTKVISLCLLMFLLGFFLRLVFHYNTNIRTLNQVKVTKSFKDSLIKSDIDSLFFYDYQIGKRVSNSIFTDSVVFLNFWATWCKPCIREFPDILALKDSLKDTKIKFVIATHEQKPVLQKFIIKNPQLKLDYYRYQDKLPDVFTGLYIPRTYIIYRGKIIFKESGARNWNTESVRHFLRKVDSCFTSN